jgi:acetoin utilization protein AcuC
LAWSDELLGYDFGWGHPMAPYRLASTLDLARGIGLLDSPDLQVVPAPVASDAVIARIHTRDFIAAVHRAMPDPTYGLGTEDCPVFPHMHDAAARQVGASVQVASAVASGHALHGMNIAGGMHHAQPGHASGFCIYNDAAVAVAHLLDSLDVSGRQPRIAYIDIDAHHGDGVETAFWDDPRVMTISVHQDGDTLFPGSGPATAIGGPHAPGSAVNIALPPRTTSHDWLRAFGSIVPAVVGAFAPDVIVSQHGCDSHGRDPLSDLRVSVYAQNAVAAEIHRLAHQYCGGRWVALGGGGYATYDVVPLVWTSLLAVALHRPLDLARDLPVAWVGAVEEVTGMDVATLLEEPTPWEPESVQQTRVVHVVGPSEGASAWPPTAPTSQVPAGLTRAEKVSAAVTDAIADTQGNIFPLLHLVS